MMDDGVISGTACVLELVRSSGRVIASPAPLYTSNVQMMAAETNEKMRRDYSLGAT